jgi:hypothetical protein
VYGFLHYREPALAPAGEAQLGLTTRGSHGGDSWLYASARHGLYADVAQRRGVLLLGGDATGHTNPELLLHYGEPDVNGVPGPGWYSTAEDQRQPAAVVDLTERAQTRAVFASLFLLGARAAEHAELALGEQGVGQLSLDMDIEGTPLRVRVQNLAAGAATERVTLE